MFDSKVSVQNTKSGTYFSKDTTDEMAQVENTKLREKVAQLEKDIINISVEIENKNSIIDNMQTWKNLLALLNSPQYSEVSIQLNKKISEFDNMDAEYLKTKKDYLNTKKQYKKLEEGVEALSNQYSNDVKNMKVINSSTFELEKINIQNTLAVLTEEAQILSSKNEELASELLERPYYKAYDDIRNEITQLKDEYENLKKIRDFKAN